MVKNVTKFHKRHLWGRGMLESVYVQDFIQDFEFREGGIQSSVLMWKGV